MSSATGAMTSFSKFDPFNTTPSPGSPDLVQFSDNTPTTLVLKLMFTVLHLLSSIVYSLITLTHTIPRLFISILSWGGVITLTFNFQKVVILFALSAAAATAFIKYKYLNRYTELRETPLSKTEGLDLNPDVAVNENAGGFSNYLDEFLSAIRVFGFLEKPVFHELARHLQTRRLIAGDTLSLDSDKSFYIVVDGTVQVFAQTSSQYRQSPDDPLRGMARSSTTTTNSTGSRRRSMNRRSTMCDGDALYDDEDQNGFQLLNEVGSGGTLSSLFTILSLFTEDVKLRYEEDGENGNSSGNGNSGGGGGAGGPKTAVPGAAANEDVSYLHLGPSVENTPLNPSARSTHPRRPNGSSTQQVPAYKRRSGSSASSNTSTVIPDEPTSSDYDTPVPDEPSPRGRPNYVSSPPSFPTVPTEVLSSDDENDVVPGTPGTPGSFNMGISGGGNRRRARSSTWNQRTEREQSNSQSQSQSPPRESIIARATVDTTLAVIPAEAFKRLTKKFPNAAAHIVQVILTRLQRVTFLTSHKYLGLTKEVVRTEKAINELAVYPLPSSFYQSGGVERLRQRFLPETKAVGGGSGTDLDYFALGLNYSPGTTPHARAEVAGGIVGGSRSRGIMARTMTSGLAMSQRAGSDQGIVSNRPADAIKLDWDDTSTTTPKKKPAGIKTGGLVMTGVGNHEGELISSPDEAQYRSGLPTPKPGRGTAYDRQDTLRQSPTQREDTLRPRSTSFSSLGPLADFDLRDAVMDCISKSIGLIHTPISEAPSVEASPMIHAHEGPSSIALQRAAFNSSFGSLSFLGTQGYDDESSLSSSSIHSLGVDMDNEVEILFFPRGGTLVKAGESNAGLFYVIDGFLDVSMPQDEGVLHDGFPASPHVGPVHGPPTPSTGIGAKGRVVPNQGRASGLGGRYAPERLPPKRPDRTEGDPKGVSFRADEQEDRTTGKDERTKRAKALFTVKAGGIAGYLSALSGVASYVNITAKTDVYVGFLPTKALERIMDRRPIVLLTLAKRLISLLSPLVLHIDSALEWMHVNAGQVLYRQGDKSDSFYIVINGRLRSIREKSGGGVEILGEYGQGESVGELDCITATPRPSTLHAIRDTELARMPMTLFNAISVRHPATTIQISRIIASRVRKEIDSKPKLISSPINVADLGKNNLNLKTVAILPVRRDVPVADFASRLRAALEEIGAPTAYLNQATVIQVQGRHAFSRMGKLKLAGWLAETEMRHRIVLYVVDTPVSSPWTQTAIRQADCILLVAHGGGDPAIGEYERLLVGMKTTARKELVLLHPERGVPAGLTRPWLQNRSWVHAHHHVEMSGALPTRAPVNFVDPLRNFTEKVQDQIGKYRRRAPGPHLRQRPFASDFARLARRLCGKSVGLVLGGGGARGIAHIGVLQALAEKGIPVDMVGGTSIGSFIGGLYAQEADIVQTLGRAKRFAGRMATLWRMLTDVTYPIVSYTTGHEFNRGIYKSFYSHQIEDFILPYFCNTTNITWSRMEVHTTGFAWRYIRASMSLAGLLPPMCDEGHMLVDGGYCDNLPVSVMVSMGASTVFAVDVGAVDDTSPRHYGETLSGWWMLLNRMNPWSEYRKIPDITEIQSRLTYVSSVKSLEEAKSTPGVMYMRMPVTHYGTLEWKKFNEILEKGYRTAQKMLDDWEKEGKLPKMSEAPPAESSSKKRGLSLRRNSI